MNSAVKASMTDEEREAHISDCGRLMQQAYGRGNREEALGWMQAQREAIKARSLNQVATMESCYFIERGAADRAALNGAPAHG